MRSATILSSLVLSLFLSFASPAYGFFEILDRLQPKASPKSELTDVIKRLEEAKDASVTGFKDVKADAWFGTYVSSVAKWGIVSGYKDKDGKPTGKYGPGDPVTVAEILKMAMKAAKTDEKECPATVKHPKAGAHWAKVYVACGEAWGVRLLQGNPDLNRGASRAEVLTILFDSFKDTVPQESSDFTDAHGHAYEADIAYAAKLGIVSGDKDGDGNPKGTFRPNDKVNRAEAAKMIYLKVAAAVAKKKAEEGGAEESAEGDEFDVDEEELAVDEEEVTMNEEVQPEPVTIAINTRNYIFSPSLIRVKKGQEVTLTFQNT
ncbi:S-layer homology domain-containing protein, partial [Candidatus Peregrinibacteria bacterium]|nr:S-layer homology domain-containing protein [Candidatus Peregrinibacteria bacterium]